MSFSVIVGGGGTGGGGGSSAWADITGKPSTFPPSTHAHPISEVTSLQAALDAKQASLVSATNIKTINGSSLLGAGDLVVAGELADGDYGDFTVTGGVASLTAGALSDTVLKADTSIFGFAFVIDEDDLLSNSDTKIPTQQSVKAYVDAVAGVSTMAGLTDLDDSTAATGEAIFKAASGYEVRSVFVADVGDLTEISLAENNFLVGGVAGEEEATPTEVLAILKVEPGKGCSITAFNPADAVSTGDGKGIAIVPAVLAGHDINSIIIGVTTPGTTSGTIIVQVARIRAGVVVDICTTRAEIQVGEYTSLTGVQAVINAANADLEAGDILRVDVDGITGVAPFGLVVAVSAVIL